MKYVAFILIVFVSFVAKSQIRFPTGFPTQSNTGWNKWGYVMSDSGLIVANRDTNWLAKYSGTVVFKPSDKKFYWFDSTNLTWNLLNSAIDTTSLSNRINLKLNISDTASMLLPYLRKADTTNKWVQDVYVRNDSLFKFKNGIESFLDTLNGGAGSGLTSVGLSMPSAFSVSGSPLTSNGTINISGAGTTAQYIRGNGTLATTDTGMIPTFHLKVRSLFSATSPITYNSTTGGIGVLNANTSGQRGVATFSNSDFGDNGSGLISLSTLVTAGPCTNCSITFGADGRATAYANGSGPVGGAVDTMYRTPGIDSIFFTINSIPYAIKDSVGAGGSGTVTQVNSGFGLSGGPITNIGTLLVDTSTLKAVYLPLNLNANKTINQATRNITFAGGGQVVLDSTRHTQTYISPTLLSDSLVTFGNSITFGSNATVPDSAYVNRTAAYYGLSLSNRGVGGTVAYQACASNLAWINPGHAAATTFCIGFNDYRVNGGGANMFRGIKNAYEAAMVNQFLESYVSASNGAVTRYGSWTTNYDAVTNSGGKTTTAAYSSTLDDSLTTDIIGTSVALGVIGLFGSLRDCIVYIDGARVDSFSTSAQTVNAGTTYQSMGKYYTGLSNGTHHVKVKVGPGSNFLLIDYIGTFVPTASMQPFVFIHIPHMDSTGYAGGLSTAAIIDAGNDTLTAAYNRALAAGLNVYLAQTNNYYIATTSSGLSSDHIHPNDLGMYQIFTAIRFGLSSAVATDGTLRYSNDGHFYGTKIDGSLNQIPYTSDLTLQRVLTNGSYLTTPAYISGTNTLDFQGFSRISLRKFQISASNETAYMHGILGTQGPNATLVIGERSLDTTKGFILYTSGDIYRTFDMYNNVDIISTDTSLRTLYRNTYTNSFLVNAAATLHIAGNTLGAAGHAPFKIDTCVLLGTPERYAIEVTADSIYWTNFAGARVALNRNGGGAATTIYNGNGTLSADRNVSSGGFTLRFDGANNSDTLVSITNTGTTSTGLFSYGTFYGADIQSTWIGAKIYGLNNAFTATSDNDEAAIIRSNSDRGLRVQSVPASTNTVQEVMRIERGSSGGVGGNGIGAEVDFYNKVSDNSSVMSNQFISKFTNATVGSRVSQFMITGVDNASTNTILTINGDGALQLNKYGSGSFTGTPTFTLQSNSSGNIIEGPLVSSGTWSPTLTDVANSTGASLGSARYSRIGNIVTFAFTFTTTTSAGSTATSVSATLPVASNFTVGDQASGTNCGLTGNIVADFSNDVLSINWVSGTGGSETITVVGQYVIL